MDVARAQAIELEDLNHDPYAFYLPTEATFELRRKEHATLMRAADEFGSGIPSLMRDLADGRQAEIDYWNGRVASIGRRVGVETPLPSTMAEMVHEIEKGARTIRPENIDELRARADGRPVSKREKR